MNFDFSHAKRTVFVLKNAWKTSAKFDEDFGDSKLDVTRTGEALVRVSATTWKKTGKYVFIKLFK